MNSVVPSSGSGAPGAAARTGTACLRVRARSPRRRSRRASACTRSPRRPARCRGARRPTPRASASRSGRGSRTHTASTPARVGGGDRAAGRCMPAPTTSRLSPARSAGPVLRAQHARQRLDQRRAERVELVRQDEQFVDQLGWHAHALGEPAGVEAGGAEALAQRLVAAAAAPALAARRVVVDRDAVADRHVRTPSPTAVTSPGRLVARAPPGSLRAHVPVGHVGGAHRRTRAPRQTTSPGPRTRVGDAPRCAPRRARPSARPSCRRKAPQRAAVHRPRDAPLGHQRRDQRRPA